MNKANRVLKEGTLSKRLPGILGRRGKNPRYFSDPAGKPVYLTGSHTWSSMQEFLGPDREKKFDYTAYLDWMEGHGFNFMRGWVWEEASYDNFSSGKLYIGPLPYMRTGPGKALDGELRFDLNTFNQKYFDRMRKRIMDAGARGIYVSIMLFNKWSINDSTVPGALPWNGHPFNKNNNINGVDGDPSKLGGRAVHTLEMSDVVRFQEEYIKKVIDTVNDLENVLYEIGNEHYEDSCQWQYHLAKYIKNYEAGKPLQHPVGITSGGGGPDALTNRQLMDSPADWISPREEADMPYMDEPAAADGSKVIITDTDHLWGMGGSIDWVWKSFTRGLNPILMDPYEPIHGLENFGVEAWSLLNDPRHPMWEPIRMNMAYTRAYAQRMKLESAVPRSELASSGFCLADYGYEYLVYIPCGKEVTVDLGKRKGEFSIEWMNPEDGCSLRNDPVTAEGRTEFRNPFGKAAVLYIVKSDNENA